MRRICAFGSEVLTQEARTGAEKLSSQLLLSIRDRPERAPPRLLVRCFIKLRGFQLLLLNLSDIARADGVCFNPQQLIKRTICVAWRIWPLTSVKPVQVKRQREPALFLSRARCE